MKVNGFKNGEIDFTFALLKQVSAQAPTANVFLSAFSVSQAMLLAAYGTTEHAQAAFLSLIGLPSADNDILARDKRALLSLLRPSKDTGGAESAYEWTVATALWSRFAPKPEYAAFCQQFFGATAAPLTTAAAINEWADEATRGRIPNIVDEYTVLNVDLVLTNAVYFKGRWLHPFETYATRDAPFHLANGTTRSQPFMHDAWDTLPWYAARNYEAITLPYRGNMSMVILLPSTWSNAQEVLNSLSATEWNALRKGMKPSRIALDLPKFEVEYEASLLAALRKLGMPTEGDFSPVSDQLADSFLGDVLHRTFLCVDEKGTEAAAVTSVAVAGGAGPRVAPRHPFIVDKPFLCAVVHENTNDVLFTGIIHDPLPLTA